MPTPTAYSRTQIALHWIIAALVIFQIVAHDGIVQVWLQRMRGDIPNEFSPNPHALIGTVILVLVLWRLWLRLTRGAPAMPDETPAPLRWLALGVHGLLYLLLIGMPIAGAVAWFVGIPQPALAHSLAAKLLYVLVLLHVAGGLVEHFWLKSNVLRRMLGRA